MIARAAARGEAAAGTEAQHLAELLAGLLYLRVLFMADPVDDAFLNRTVISALPAPKGAAAAGPTRPCRPRLPQPRGHRCPRKVRPAGGKARHRPQLALLRGMIRPARLCP